MMMMIDEGAPEPHPQYMNSMNTCRTVLNILRGFENLDTDRFYRRLGMVLGGGTVLNCSRRGIVWTWGSLSLLKKISCFQLHRSKKLGKEGGKFIFIFYFDMEKLHSKVHFVHLYVDVQNTFIIICSEIFLTKTKVNLLGKCE